MFYRTPTQELYLTDKFQKEGETGRDLQMHSHDGNPCRRFTPRRLVLVSAEEIPAQAGQLAGWVGFLSPLRSTKDYYIHPAEISSCGLDNHAGCTSVWERASHGRTHPALGPGNVSLLRSSLPRLTMFSVAHYHAHLFPEDIPGCALNATASSHLIRNYRS